MSNEKRWLVRGIAGIGVMLLVATTASAQDNADAGPRLPLWDATGTLGIHSIRASEVHSAERLYEWWETLGEPGFATGRYLTPHLKFEVGVRGPMNYRFVEPYLVPAPGLPGGVASTYIDRHVRLVSCSPVVTWQFFENAFVHPYVSAGVALDVLDVHRLRTPTTANVRQSNGTTVRYDVPGVDTHQTVVNVRPVFGAGTKSYFNDRWFVRPDVQLEFMRAGIGQVSLRLGVGADF